MAEKNENENAKELLDESDYEYEKQIYDEQKQRQAEIERKRRAIIEERKRREKEAKIEHDKQIAKERIELMKLKNGVSSAQSTVVEIENDDEQTDDDNESVQSKSSFKKKADNFFYQNKWWLGIASIVLIVGIFLLYGQLTKKDPDLTVIVIANNDLEFKQDQLGKLFEEYVDDVDGNGYVHVSVIPIPLGKKDEKGVEQTQYRSQFLTLLHSTEDMIVVTDSDTDPYYMEIMDHDLKSKFPGNKYIDENGFSLNMKLVADKLEYENMPNDIHVSIRQDVPTVEDSLETAKKNYDKSFKCLEKMVNDLTKQAEQTNDPGLKAKEKKPVDSSLAK